MPDLPQELVAAIISAIQEQNDPGSYRLAPLACINRNWQAAVERRIWNHMSIEAKTQHDKGCFEMLQQYTSGPEKRLRRSCIRVLSIGWFYEMPELKQDTTVESINQLEMDTKGHQDESILDSDTPWDFPEILPYESDGQLESEAQDHYEPDWDRVNAAIWSDTSGDETDSKNESESHDSDNDKESKGGVDMQETLDEGTADTEGPFEARSRVESHPSWDDINALVSKDEPEPGKPHGSDDAKDELLQHLKYTQNSLFLFIESLWRHLASWDEQANVKRINLQLVGNAFNTSIYQGLKHDGAYIVRFLRTTLHCELSLPSLPRLMEVFVDGRRGLAYWPALVAVRVAMAPDLPVPVVEFRARDIGKWWKEDVIDDVNAEGMYMINEPGMKRLPYRQ